MRAGALVLRGALPYLPPGVHLAVVDPTVGAVGEAARRAVALRTAEEGRLLVGPDNGLLMPAADRLGGVVEAVDIGESPERLHPVSRTFHGRDLFAPVAGALADGQDLQAVGRGIAAEGLRRLQLPTARTTPEGLAAHVLHADGFGNLILDATPEQIDQIGVRQGDRLAVTGGGGEHTARYVGTFAEVDPGELLLYEDGIGQLALAVNGGSAAQTLGAGRDDELVARRA